MTTDSNASNGAISSKRAYASRIGFVADSPNFPGDWDQIVEKVKIADELGFDSVWLGESWGYELFTSMSDLVRATKRIQIGAGIANIYSRTPALIASTTATLDERSGGRIKLGLGPSGANVVEHWHGHQGGAHCPALTGVRLEADAEADRDEGDLLARGEDVDEAALGEDLARAERAELETRATLDERTGEVATPPPAKM